MTDLMQGHTQLDDLSGLKYEYITSIQQLYDLEFINISTATGKYLGSSKVKPITIALLQRVHKDMFEDVWEWAGVFRKTELNIGVKPYRILTELKIALDNLSFNESNESMSLIERIARFHHSLVKIHPFVNGNGRWSRLIVNYYLKAFKLQLNWPEIDIYKLKKVRAEYISALQDADQGNFSNLIELLEEWLKK